MTILDLLQELDGAGLIITDADLVKEELDNLGLSWDDTITLSDK